MPRGHDPQVENHFSSTIYIFEITLKTNVIISQDSYPHWHLPVGRTRSKSFFFFVCMHLFIFLFSHPEVNLNEISRRLKPLKSVLEGTESPEKISNCDFSKWSEDCAQAARQGVW